MRLIDADAVLKWFDEYWAMQKKLGRPSKQQRAIYMTMRTMVNSRKTEDAVPVVRCCDCKYYEEQDETISIDDDLKDYDEVFVGNVRDGDRLIRCEDCRYFGERMTNGYWSCGRREGCVMTIPEGFCGWAVRRKDNG